MEEFWKAAALVLLSVILGLAVGKREKDIAALLSIAACCMVAVVLLSYIRPVLDLVWELEAIANLQDGFLSIVLKAVGITFIAELAGMICKDAGNETLGKTVQMLGSAAIVSFSIPIVRAFLSMIQEILGQL